MGVRGKARWLGGNGVGDEDGVEVDEGFARMGKNRGDLSGGAGGEFGGWEALEIQDGG